MPIIKRYPNRKLYNTTAKQYVSLEGIAEMIRRGDEVQVVDHTTGEDLTTLTLTQIIVEQEKQQSGFLPSPVLTGLIRSGGNTLAHLRRSLSTPLDLFRQVDDEIERRLQKLVGLGEMAEGEAQRLLEKLTAAGQHTDMPPGDAALEQGLRIRTLPTRSDLRTLSELLDQLSAQVDELAKGKTERH
jgi:polyhydroxyalkanoate synthesis repressor PhaR